MLRGVGKRSARTGGDTRREDLPADSDVRGGGGNRQQQTHVAESFAAKGTALPGAITDGRTSVSRCTERTLRSTGVAAGRTQGCQAMRRALSRRNPGITEEAGTVAEWQFLDSSVSLQHSKRSVNLQATHPVQVYAKAGAGSLWPTGCRLRPVFLLTEYC